MDVNVEDDSSESSDEEPIRVEEENNVTIHEDGPQSVMPRPAESKASSGVPRQARPLNGTARNLTTSAGKRKAANSSIGTSSKKTKNPYDSLVIEAPCPSQDDE